MSCRKISIDGILSLSVLCVLQKFLFEHQVSADTAPRLLSMPDYERIIFAPVNQTLELQCPIENIKFVEWYRGNQPDSLYMTNGYTMKKSGILRIKSVSKEYAGTYTCEGVNGYGYVRANMTVIVDGPMLSVENVNSTPINRNAVSKVHSSPPSIQQRSSTKFIEELDGQANFHCVASGDAPLKMFWMKNSQLLQNADVEISQGKAHSTLKLRGLKLSDAGTYTCVARNQVGIDTQDYSLKVIESTKPPQIVSFEPPTAIIAEGETAVFWCEVHSKNDLKLHVKWLKRLNEEETGPSINLDNTILFKSGTTVYRPLNLSDSSSRVMPGIFKSKLLIRNSRKEDSGIYVCLALNDKGFNFKNVSLTVLSATKSFTSHSATTSFFSLNDTSFIVIVIIAVAIIFSLLFTLYLCSKSRLHKNISIRQVNNMERSNPMQNWTYRHIQGTTEASNPKPNDHPYKSSLYPTDSTYVYETEKEMKQVCV